MLSHEKFNNVVQSNSSRQLEAADKDHTLILIDFQSQMAAATRSFDSVVLRNNAAGAHAAAGFEVDHPYNGRGT